MSFQKNKLTKFGVEANYHTITDVKMSFINLPRIVDGSPIGGSVSTITLSTYKDRETYLNGSAPFEQISYSVDFMTALSVARSTDKTCENAAYDLIKLKDSFWSDALDVE